jgi:phage terminase large subunit
MANNEDNLKGHGFDERTAEEQREIARAGGIASGEARRRKRTLKEIAEMLADEHIAMPQPDGTTKDMTYDVALIQTMYRNAITKGDTQAAKFLANLLGEEQLAAQQVTIYNVPQQTADGMQRIEQTDL